MNKKIIFGFSLLVISLLIFTTIAKADEEFTSYHFSDQVTPGAELKWHVDTLTITQDFKNEIYFNISNYNLTQGDTLIIKVQKNPNDLPQPYGWIGEDWFDVYLNDILVYDNSSLFYNDFANNGQEVSDDFLVPVWFIYPSQLTNSTGTYFVHEIIYEELAPFKNDTSKSDSSTYPPYKYDYNYQFKFWVEKDNNGVNINWYTLFNLTMTDTTNNKVYYSHLEMKLLYRINKDGLADQYYLYMKLESVLPPTAPTDLNLNQNEEMGNGTVEFSILREGYHPPSQKTANTFSIPFPTLVPILGIIVTAALVIRRRK